MTAPTYSAPRAGGPRHDEPPFAAPARDPAAGDATFSEPLRPAGPVRAPPALHAGRAGDPIELLDGAFGARASRRLAVLSVAPQGEPLGPDTPGGAAHMVRELDRALVAAGHRSIVVAPAGSAVAGELVPVRPPLPGRRGDRAAAVRAAIASVLNEADLVHFHDAGFAACLPPPGPPVLVTLHQPIAAYARDAFATTRPDTWITCVTAAQQAACPRSAPLAATVPNGVDIEALGGWLHARRGFALMLGRVAPGKGQHLGLAAAHVAGATLLVAGPPPMDAPGQAYFEQEVRPLLDRCRRWLGPLDFVHKRRLLAAARCVLIPSVAPETSALVAMEAAACGTPVIAFASAALRDVVEDGRTGFLVRGAGEMAAAMARVDRIAPAACRAIAAERFGLARMTEAYLGRYRELARVAV